MGIAVRLSRLYFRCSFRESAMQDAIDKSDLVLIGAAALAVLITVLSVIWLFGGPPITNELGKTQSDAYQSLYQAVVHDTLLSLFTAVVGIKVGLVAIRVVAARFARKS